MLSGVVVTKSIVAAPATSWDLFNTQYCTPRYLVPRLLKSLTDITNLSSLVAMNGWSVSLFGAVTEYNRNVPVGSFDVDTANTTLLAGILTMLANHLPLDASYIISGSDSDDAGRLKNVSNPKVGLTSVPVLV